MAGRGFPPKDPSRTTRGARKDAIKLRIVQVEPATQPELPEFDISVKVDGALAEQAFVWPAATRRWWEMLGQHPLRHEFAESDWSYLLDTAMVHAAFWQGRLDHAGELRLREAKYGFTPEDRARLRVQFAQAVSAEVSTAARVSAARDRFPTMEIADEIPAPHLQIADSDEDPEVT